MKKHIIGLTLFSFIVSAAAVVYAFFNVPEIIPVSEVVAVSAPQYVPVQRNHCKMRRQLEESEVNSSIITQAVFNMKTKKLSWNLVSADSDYPTLLHFFVKDEKGLRQIPSLYVEYAEKDGELNFSESYGNLSRISPRANLYLIADTNSYLYSGDLKRVVEFDSSKAIPVIIDYGK